MRNIKILSIIITTLVIGILFNVDAATIRSANSGNWSSSSTWIGGNIPTVKDSVIISNGHTVTVDGSDSCAALVIDGGNSANGITISGTNLLYVARNAVTLAPTANNEPRTINVANGVLIVKGNIYLTSGGTGAQYGQLQINNGTCNLSGDFTVGPTAGRGKLIFSGSGTLNIGGNMSSLGANFQCATGTVNYNRLGNQTLGAHGTSPYYNLILSGSGIKNNPGTINIAANGKLEITGTATYSGQAPSYNATSSLIYSGSAAQTTGSEFADSTGVQIKIDNSNGVTLNGNKKTTGTITLTNGNLNTDSYTLTAIGNIYANNGYIVGRLRKLITASGTTTFEIGDINYYLPVDVNFASITSSGFLTVNTVGNEHPDIAHSGIHPNYNVNRYWTLVGDGGLTFSTCYAIFRFNENDIDAGADYNNFVASKKDGAQWALASVGSKTQTSIQVTNITSLSDFVVGEKRFYQIIPWASYGGSISPSDTVKLELGEDQLFTFSANSYHHLDSLVVDGINHGKDSTSYKFEYVNEDHTIKVYFSPDSFSITATAYGNGTIEPAGITWVLYDSSQRYTITPNPYHHIDSVLVDGVNQGAISEYTFYNVNANHTIDAYFSPDSFSITATAHGNGTINPSGVTWVLYNGNQGYTITPNPYHHIDSVLVDGVNQGAINEYTFYNVNANHTIDAYFSPDSFSITATAHGNGTINPSGVTWVLYDSSQRYTITPDEHYHTDSVLVDGVNQGAIGEYTFYNVNSNHTIDAYFSIDKYSISGTITDGSKGYISGVLVTATGGFSGSDETDVNGYYEIIGVPYGTINITLTPTKTGYTFTPPTRIITGPVTGNVTGQDFTGILNTYTITASAVGPGTINPSGNVQVTHGDNKTFYINANTGAHIDSVKVDGVNQGAISQYTFYNVTTNHTITAYFSLNTHTLNVMINPADGGTVTLNPPGGVYSYGTEVQLQANPTLGWHFVNWTGGVTSTENPITIIVYSDTNITANFEINTYTLTVNINGNGTVNREPNQTNYIHGTWVKLTAYPDLDWTFDSWSGDLTSSNNPDSVYMNDNKTVTANFTFTGVSGWTQRESMPPLTGVTKWHIKEGGAIVGVPGNPSVLYAFRGTKTSEFKKYTLGSGWADVAPIPFGYKYKPSTGVTDSSKFATKGPGKGAALCYDGENTIYAIKGNGLWEFWAYDIANDTWILKPWIPSIKAPKGGSGLAYYDGYVYLLVGSIKLAENYFFRFCVAGDSWEVLPKPTSPSLLKPWKAGSALATYNGKIYAMKAGEKPNWFLNFNPSTFEWGTPETLTTFDSVAGKVKKLYVKAGGCMAAAENGIYGIKGGGTNTFYKYTPTTGWVQLFADAIPKLHKKSVPKEGAAMSYVAGKVWLLKGNKTPEFWSYTPSTEGTLKPIVTPTTMGQRLTLTDKFSLDITPNPFDKLTTIRYTVPVAGNVVIKLYNASGRLIKTLVNEYHTAGNYTLTLSAEKMAKGIYFVKCENEGNSAKIKLIVQ